MRTPLRRRNEIHITLSDELAALTHPTAMAFGPNGELYVTMLSTPGNENQADGKLIKFEPGL